jgi:hypothetical protein
MVLKQIHGVAGVSRAEENKHGMRILVVDWFGRVKLDMPYEASMTPEQARYLGQKLIESADRVDADLEKP